MPQPRVYAWDDEGSDDEAELEVHSYTTHTYIYTRILIHIIYM
jgi:hypothetical protein